MTHNAIYTGTVIRFNNPPDPSQVVLQEVSTGKTIEVDAASEKLVKAGLKQGDVFEILYDEKNGIGDIVKLDSSVSEDFNI